MSRLSLSDYADLIIAHVYAGLKGITNIPISKQAVMEEFNLYSRQLLGELMVKKDYPLEDFYQICTPIELKKYETQTPFEQIGAPDKMWVGKIPKVFEVAGCESVDFFSPVNYFRPYLHVKHNLLGMQQYSRFHSKEPAFVLKGDEVWVTNKEKGVTKMQLRAVFANPLDLIDEEDPYPVSESFAGKLVDLMTEKYTRHYYLKNAIPNTQSDIKLQAPANS